MPEIAGTSRTLQSEYERGKRETAERCAEIAGDSARWQKYADKPRHIAGAIRSEFSLSEKGKK